MTDYPVRHARAMASLVFVRERDEASQDTCIRSVALFQLQQDGQGGATFTLHHRAFDCDANRADTISGLADRITATAAIISPASNDRGQNAYDERASAPPMPPSDLALLQRHRADVEVITIRCQVAALDETAAALGLRRAGPGSSTVAQCRHAPEEAQCLWLTYLWTHCRRVDRITLTAAWEAWRALERARPLPF